jgi:signal peptidase II
MPIRLTAATALVVIVVDQSTKAIATTRVVAATWIEPAENPDLALGVLGGSTAVEVVAAAIGILALAAVLWRTAPADLDLIGIGLLSGGALGNLIDRVSAGAVRDFLVGPGFLFNLADIALLTGAGVLACRYLLRARPEVRISEQ